MPFLWKGLAPHGNETGGGRSRPLARLALGARGGDFTEVSDRLMRAALEAWNIRRRGRRTYSGDMRKSTALLLGASWFLPNCAGTTDGAGELSATTNSATDNVASAAVTSGCPTGNPSFREADM